MPHIYGRLLLLISTIVSRHDIKMARVQTEDSYFNLNSASRWERSALLGEVQSSVAVVAWNVADRVEEIQDLESVRNMVQWTCSLHGPQSTDPTSLAWQGFINY